MKDETRSKLIEKLIRFMVSSYHYDTCKIMNTMVMSKDERDKVIQFIVDKLLSSDGKLKRRCLRSIRHINLSRNESEMLFPKISICLSDSDSSVRYYASYAIGYLNLSDESSEKAIKFLLNVINDIPSDNDIHESIREVSFDSLYKIMKNCDWFKKEEDK